MYAASAGAIVAHPGTMAAFPGPALSLKAMLPKQFGDWCEETQRAMMGEAQAIAEKRGITFGHPIEKPIAGTQAVGAHRIL
jgi:hypothetical protein